MAARVQIRIAEYIDQGFAPGDRAFIHFGNCNEFFVELLAIWAVGGCAVPVDPRFTPFEIKTLADWGRPRVSVWLGGIDPEVGDAMQSLSIRVANLAERQVSKPRTRRPAPGFRLDDDALILFTSGTTGQPKGVVHTHRSLLARWTHLRDHLGLASFERTLCLLPTHFGHGLICNSLFPWLNGCDLHLLPSFKPEIVADLGRIIDENDITFISSVPALWRLAKRISGPPTSRSLRRVFIGSAPLSASLWNTVLEWSGADAVFNSYGITETASWLAGTTVPNFAPEDGLIGVPWGGSIRILRTKEPIAAEGANDAACKRGESGYIWVQTPALMRGYLDRDDLTAQVVRQGWFLTGDIGMFDERGWLYLKGREREEINKGGMKVYPADVDSVIERYENTMDVCTFAYADSLLGEDVGVAVVLNDSSDASLQGLFQWAVRHLASHQLPQRWYVLTEISRTSRGKVNRSSVAEICSRLKPVNMAALARSGADA